MILGWTFWLLLLAPGACLFLCLRPNDHQASVFETISVGYVLSFLVLAPFCIVGYALALPLWVFSAAIVLSVVASLPWLARRLRAHGARFAFTAEYAAATLLIALLLLHAAAMGGHVANDADFHLARIRFLYDHGLSNADPVTGTGFTHPYHTNILHALVAAGARLTGLDPIALWQSSLPWAKLVVASGAATLCLRLGGSGLAAWTVCLFQLGTTLQIGWALYPNSLAPFWLMAVGLASCIGLFASEHTRYHALLIGSSALLLGLVHGLYAGYFVFLGAAMIGVLCIHRAIARKGDLLSTLRLALLGALLLSVPGPSLYVARYSHAPAQSNFDYQGGSPKPRASKPGRWTHSLRADADGRFHLRASRLLGGTTQQCLTMAAVICLLVRRRFVEVLGLCTTLGSCLLLLHMPELANLVVETLGAAWMLERLMDVVVVQRVALVGAGLVPALSTARSAAYVMGLLPVAAAVIGALTASGGFSKRSLEKIGLSFNELSHLQVLGSRLPSSMELDQELLRKIPPGSMVLTHPLAARQLRKLHDIEFLRASRNHTGVDDMLDRTVAMHTLVYAKGPTKKVRQQLARYGIHYAVQKSDHPIGWLGSQPVIAETPTLKLIKLDVGKPIGGGV